MSSMSSDLQENRLSRRFSFRSPETNRCEIDPRLPHWMVRHFLEIDFVKLAQLGIRYLCLDVDNTLLPQTAEKIDSAVVRRLQEIRANGLVRDLCLLSNIIWTRGERRFRLMRLARDLEIPLVYGASFWTRKPSGRPFQWALSSMGALPGETAMVGDQIFSDVVGGNRMGLFTILVRPMSGDHWTTTLVGRRWSEALFFRHYRIER